MNDRIDIQEGGPGAGKGTLCAELVQQFGFAHFSAGDLLRKAAKEDTDLGHELSQLMKEGKIVPSEVTIGLLKDAIAETTTTDTFLIDGFPRNIDQGEEFESTITKCRFVIFLEAPQGIMQQRILKRAAETNSARADDNLASLEKRFKTHYETCMPVIDHFKAQDKVVQVSWSVLRKTPPYFCREMYVRYSYNDVFVL